MTSGWGVVWILSWLMKARTVWPGASAPGWATRPASTASFAPKVWRTLAFGSSIFSSAWRAWLDASSWRRSGSARLNSATAAPSRPRTSAAIRRTVWTSRPNRRATSLLGMAPSTVRAATASLTPCWIFRLANRQHWARGHDSVAVRLHLPAVDTLRPVDVDRHRLLGAALTTSHVCLSIGDVDVVEVVPALHCVPWGALPRNSPPPGEGGRGVPTPRGVRPLTTRHDRRYANDSPLGWRGVMRSTLQATVCLYA
jgi:hypothetical protein